MRRFARGIREGQTRWVEVDVDGRGRLLAGEPGSEALPGSPVLEREDLRQFRHLAPCAPEKVIGLAYNYKSLVGHRSRYDEPLFFLKSPTSICGQATAIPYPDFSDKVWVEVELGIVIKKDCFRVSVEEAGDYILGYTIGSDVTAENICGRDWHLARSKALDGFAPAGPYLVMDVQTDDLELATHINGKEFQRGRTSDRIVNDREAVSLLSRFVTLRAGDLILTGTPAGARDSIVKPGDVVTHRIQHLGELSFTFI
jgi:2-keto-4-pentenoate hydratase/2-oxohepta-3-ene-1,7-dioic acid hydratase in catechol pathway